MRNSKLWIRGFLFLLGASIGGTALAGNFPVAPYIPAGIANAIADPAGSPAGANPAFCSSSVDPYPVILVNGTFTDMRDDYGALAPDLANAGYCVYAFNYGGNSPNDLIQATAPMVDSVQQLAAFVNHVMAQTGAAQVDLIGHSEGGLLAEYYIKFVGGATNVHRMIGLSPPTHGLTLSGLLILADIFPGANQVFGDFCPACYDQEAGSALVTQLSNGPVAQPGVSYTIIETQDELVVTPVGSAFIQEPGVTNEYVQSFCGLDPVDHADLSYDNVVIQLIKNALSPSAAVAPNCFIGFPYPAI